MQPLLAPWWDGHEQLGRWDSLSPLQVGPVVRLTDKVNSKAPAKCHESLWDVKFCTVFGFQLTMGYTRHGDAKDADGQQITHAWVRFGVGCTEMWMHNGSRHVASALPSLPVIWPPFHLLVAGEKQEYKGQAEPISSRDNGADTQVADTQVGTKIPIPAIGGAGG